MGEVLPLRVDELCHCVCVHARPEAADVELVELRDVPEEALRAGAELGVVPHHRTAVEQLEVVHVLQQVNSGHWPHQVVSTH